MRTTRELPVLERLGDLRGIAVVRTKIADILSSQNRLDEALQLYQQQVRQFDELGDVRSAGMTLGRIADVLGRRGQFDAAHFLQSQRLTNAESSGDLVGIAEAKASMARLRLAEPDAQPQVLEAARHDLADAFAISRKLRRPEGIAYHGLELATVLLRQGKRAEAAATLDQLQSAIDKLPEGHPLLDQRNQLRQFLSED